MSPLQISHEQTMSQRGGTTNSKLLLDIIILQHGHVLSAYRLSVLGFVASFCKTSVVSDPKKRTKKVYVELQIRLHCLSEDRASGRKSISEFLWGVSHNLRGGQPNI